MIMKRISLAVLLLTSWVGAFLLPVSTTTSRKGSAVRLSPLDVISSLPETLQAPLEELQQTGLLDQVLSVGTDGLTFVEGLPLEAKAAAVALPVAANIFPYLTVAGRERQGDAPTYPEANLATYEMSSVKIPFEFGACALVRPLLKQTQLEFRNLKVVYDANRDGYDARRFHQLVDGKGAAVILAKSRGQWFGGYNPRGWASLGGSRPSVAAFLFYQKGLFGGWQKIRVKGRGGMACGNDLFDYGVFMGAEGLVIPLDGPSPKEVRSRLGNFFDEGPGGRTTVLPGGGGNYQLQELKVIAGVYPPGEDIPNSGGVLDLGLY